MRTRPIFTSIRAALIGCLLLQAVIAASPADEPHVIVREIPACRVAYLEHAGPYWTVGETLRAVYDGAPADLRPKRFFARFASSPLASRSAALRAEVGYTPASISFADPDTASTADANEQDKTNADANTPSLPRGFQISERPAELAACVVFESGDVPRAQDFSRLRQWIARNGYRSVGPVTEVYTFPPGEVPENPRVELQMTIRPANDPSGVSTQQTASAAIVMNKTDPTNPAPAAPTQASPSQTIALDDQPTRERTPTTASTPLIVQTDPQSTPSTATSDVTGPTASSSPRPAPSDDPAPPQGPQTAESPAEPPATAPAIPPECAALVETFLPGVPNLSPETQAWLGATLLRVDAIGRAIRKASPAPSEAARCSSAMAQAFRPSLSLPGSTSLKDNAPPKAAAARSELQKKILRDLDLLMTGLASRRSEFGHADEELAVLLEHIRTIVDAELSGSEPAVFAPK